MLYIIVSHKNNIKFNFLLYFIIVICITYNKFIFFSNDSLNSKTHFNNILPKVKLNDTKIPNKTEIFKSRELFINDSKLTKEYINFIRSQNFKEQNINQNNKSERITELIRSNNSFIRFNINDYYSLCLNEKLISNISDSIFNYKPLISILVISYNKKDVILKSIRSIQNQSLKNIEIIIVDDCSTDKSNEMFKYLLETDKRIRIFKHLKNMGAWRSRLDAFLYSNAPYVIHFDAGDFYADNFVLEDMYNLISKNNLDSVRFAFRLTKNKNHLTNHDRLITFRKRETKILYGRRSFSVYGFKFGTIWNRLTKANVFNKGLDYLDEYILNSYKNIFEDRWWNTMANNASNTYLMTNRIGYIYLREPNGEGHIRIGDKKINDKSIKEIILFFLFDYNLAYSKSDKHDIINNLRLFNSHKNKLSFDDLQSNFPPYKHLLKSLINDKYVSKANKIFLLSLKHNIKS